MASIRKRGENSYLLVVSRGYDYQGNRLKPAQKTVHPPKGLTAKQTEKWLNEQAVLYEREVKHTPGESVDRSITLAKYIDVWLEQVAPKKLAASTLVRDKQDIRRILPALGHYKLVELNKDILRAFYDAMRSEQNWKTGGLLAEKQWRASIPVFAGFCPMQWRQGISRTILHGGHTGRKARRRSGRWRMRKQCKGLSRRWKARA
ncbi:N-terminal phage integrase SAM-like domain-containing protein [Ruthenibacterium lactatiformans]|uniref:N-terminal phage integrase SAM-like domain-containing protein n=1 Tax=Ruthenibacterium lactatiformans TaxID=1550024 RepID=UPI001FAAD9BF|nr:N-terminal phage integrase SAM-like domain-containing protein [Ruthenibacterium lactatiformans]